MVQFTEALREEYETLFANMSIRPARHALVERIRVRVAHPGAQNRYQQVETETKVPWFVVAILHNLEASLNFDRHLHNGDPLTDRTYHVPRNRPAEGHPPFTWPVSAADAMRYDGLHEWQDWSVPGIAYVLERFNGFGYRRHHPHVKSPYLWSFSNIYTSGKYVADGSFSETAVSQQCGGMVLLRALMDADASIRERVKFVPSGEKDDTNTKPGEGSDTVDDEIGPPFPGRYLQSGLEDDPDVLLVQQRLKKLGVDPGMLDGDFGVITEDAVKLFQARSSSPAGEPLEIDGVVGPETWAALFGRETPPPPNGLPAVGSLAARVLDIADGEDGVRENPLGSNRGPKVDQYISAAGLNPAAGSYPWCMCFVYWCFREAARELGIPNRVPRSAGVHVAWRATKALPAGQARIVLAADARRNLSLIKPGMVFFLDTGGGRGHVGIVASINNGRLETIEGNTTAISGSREGIGVFRRNARRVSDRSLMGFAAYGETGGV